MAAVILIRRGYWRRRIAGRLLILLWCLPSLSMLAAHASFKLRKRIVLQTDVAKARRLGRHFWWDTVIPRGGRAGREGADSGVYITRQYRGIDSGEAEDEISALQARRRAARLPPSSSPPTRRAEWYVIWRRP